MSGGYLPEGEVPEVDSLAHLAHLAVTDPVARALARTAASNLGADGMAMRRRYEDHRQSGVRDLYAYAETMYMELGEAFDESTLVAEVNFVRDCVERAEVEACR